MMEDNRIQPQIAIYMTNKKLCEFNDKLCCTVNTKSGGVDSHIVVIELAPLVAGVEVVV